MDGTESARLTRLGKGLLRGMDFIGDGRNVSGVTGRWSDFKMLMIVVGAVMLGMLELTVFLLAKVDNRRKPLRILTYELDLDLAKSDGRGEPSGAESNDGAVWLEAVVAGSWCSLELYDGRLVDWEDLEVGTYDSGGGEEIVRAETLLATSSSVVFGS